LAAHVDCRRRSGAVTARAVTAPDPCPLTVSWPLAEKVGLQTIVRARKPARKTNNIVYSAIQEIPNEQS